MYYLHITKHAATAEQPMRPNPTQGPFATEQEAAGFFTKLTLWYPGAMRGAEFQIVQESNPDPARRMTH